MERITLAEFHARILAQGAPATLDVAFVCPMCATVQSARTLICVGAGATFDEVEKFIGFSCIGRWTAAGPPPKDKAKDGGKGCNWTLGGLFQLHTLEVVTPDDGIVHPRFELATPEATAALAARGGWITAIGTFTPMDCEVAANG